jgi:type II secretory pathway component PulM
MSIFGRKQPATQSIGLHTKPSLLTDEAAKNLGIEHKPNPLAAALTNMNLRERILIIGLVIAIAIAATVYFAVLPAIERMNSLNEEIEALSEQKIEMEAVIARTAGYQADYELSKQEYNDYQQFFFAYMTPEDLDRTVTRMLQDAGLEPTRFSMTSLAIEELPMYAAQPLVPEVVPSYQPNVTSDVSSDPMADAPARDDGSAAPEAEAIDSGTVTSEGGVTTDASVVEDVGSLANPLDGGGSGEVYVYTVDIAAEGGSQELFSFLTTIYAMHGIEITTWNYHEPIVSVAADGTEDAGIGTVDLQIKIYVFLGEVVE